MATHTNFNVGAWESPVDVSQTHFEICFAVIVWFESTPVVTAVLEQDGCGKIFAGNIVETETDTGCGVKVFQLVVCAGVTIGEFFSKLQYRFEFACGS